MALHARHLDPGQGARAGQEGGGGRDVHPELVVAQARRDVGVRARVDVGVHAQGEGHARAAGGGQYGEAPDLVLALRVELADARLQAGRDLVVRLAHAGEHDPLRREARAQGGPQLEPGHDVRSRTQRGQEPQDGAGAVGLDRIADAMGHGRECGLVGVVGLRDGVAAVDVEGRAVRGGRLLEGGAVAGEGAVRADEAGHGRAGSACARRVAAASPLRPTTPTRLGKIWRPFIKSPQAQTSSTLLVAPNTTRPQ